MSKVIVVDDDYSTTNLMKMLLEMEGFQVSTFTDTARAMAEAENGVVLFIVDCHLGKQGSGLDLLHAIRKHEDAHLRSVPVIMVSGDHRQGEAVLEAGADRFLLKPYSPRDLTREIQELIATGA